MDSSIGNQAYEKTISGKHGVVEKREILNLVKEMEERLIVLSTFGKGSSIAHLERGCILVEMMRLAQCLVGKCAFRKFEIKIRKRMEKNVQAYERQPLAMLPCAI